MKATLKRSLARAANSGAAAVLLRAGELAMGGIGNRLAVLTYHRVDRPERRPDLDPVMISATPADFEQQMQFLSRRYTVVSLETVLDCRRAARPLPPRAVLVTFDDAYADFAEFAWPVLRALKLPATLFVPTGYPDRPAERFWWDRLHSAIRPGCDRALHTPWGPVRVATEDDRRRLLKRLKTYGKGQPHESAMRFVAEFCRLDESRPGDNGVLSWNELRRLHSEGVTLAAHTRTHPLLNRVSTAHAVEETLGSMADLQEQIGDRVLPAVAYPSGEISPEVVSALHAAGVELGFTTRRGTNLGHTCHPLMLKRINVGQTTNLGLLRAQLLPLPGSLHALWNS